jgi:hypothetical protein
MSRKDKTVAIITTIHHPEKARKVKKMYAK